MNLIRENSDQQLYRILQHSFQSLRKGTGLTPWKITKHQELRETIATHAGVNEQELSMQQAYLHVLHTLDELGNGIEAKVTRNAFAVGQEHNPGSLMQRRMYMSKQLRRHTDTIEAYENQGINKVISTLLEPDNVTNKGFAHSIPPGQPSNVSLPIDKVPTNDTIAKNLVIYGLTEIYSLGMHAPEILTCFGRRLSCYEDCTVELAFVPSAKGPSWYTYKFRCTFRSKQLHFRIGIVSSANDGEALLASGLVDDLIKLNGTPDLDKELEGLLLNCYLIRHNIDKSSQEILRFQEVELNSRRELLNTVWQVNADTCRIIELQPAPSQLDIAFYEYNWSFDLSIDEHYAYWYAPGLMYLNNISVDISQFPGREKWQFYIRPFLGTALPGDMGIVANRYTASANSWLTPGQGVAIIWQEHKS